ADSYRGHAVVSSPAGPALNLIAANLSLPGPTVLTPTALNRTVLDPPVPSLAVQNRLAPYPMACHRPDPWAVGASWRPRRPAGWRLHRASPPAEPLPHRRLPAPVDTDLPWPGHCPGCNRP